MQAIVFVCSLPFLSKTYKLQRRFFKKYWRIHFSLVAETDLESYLVNAIDADSP